MSYRRKLVIYVNGEPYTEEEDRIEHPEHALIKGTVGAMEEFMNVMTKPAENISKAIKYLIKALTLSE